MGLSWFPKGLKKKKISELFYLVISMFFLPPLAFWANLGKDLVSPSCEASSA